MLPMLSPSPPSSVLGRKSPVLGLMATSEFLRPPPRPRYGLTLWMALLISSTLRPSSFATFPTLSV